MPRNFALFGSVLSALGMLSILASCQEATAPADPGPDSESPAAVANWSDPSSWPGGIVPRAGDNLTIPVGQRMVLDVSPPELGGITIDGVLAFDRRDLSLTAEWILVKGALEIGTEASPFADQARITLTGLRGSSSVNGSGLTGMGTRVLGVVPGGDVSSGPTWTPQSFRAR